MQIQNWKLTRLVLPVVLLAATCGAARADDAEAPGIVRLGQIGHDAVEPASDAILPAPIVGEIDCLSTPWAAPSASCGGQPCEKKRGCCLFRCCLFGCCSDDDDDCDDDDYDVCENGCGKPKERCCCLWPWRRKTECETHGCRECEAGRHGCCHWLTGGLCGGRACGHGAGDAHGYYPYGSAAEMRLAHLRCKLGYFIPTGDCGHGLPWAGHYKLVYPLNPDFHDPRDSRVYSAQGYGVPVGVPLAPNVEFTYNYGWGVPSSRLTPVSRHVPGTNPILWPIPPGQRY